MPSFVYFGSSRFSEIVLEELKNRGLSPILYISSSKTPLPSVEKLKALNADVFIVASFGKILSQEILEIPKYGCLNVHPSLLPELRGPSPIQNTILQNAERGVTIIEMDEEMDHGPILTQERVEINPFPDHYEIVEEKLARAGGKLLAEILPKWIKGEIEAKPQDESRATYTKLIKKEDGLLNLSDSPQKNLLKVLAYSRWPGAHLFFTNKMGKEIRVVV